MIHRSINLPESNSYFLFGPRGSGKTSLLEATYSPQDTVFVDLLDIDTYDSLILDPTRFQQMIDGEANVNKRVVVDEIQRLPKLLNVVQQQIQKRKRQFVLTGSSSRRLKQEGANLLAGRAWEMSLYPFSTFELGKQFDLKSSLEWGGLPDAILAPNSESSREYLNAYVSTYLQKEIQAEQWVRKLEPFRKFLAIAAQMNGKIVNKSKIAQQIGVDPVTVDNYFEILEDTLIGFFLAPFHKSVRKAQKQSPKFYFIDPGIARALNRTLTIELLPQTFSWGDAFEHWVILDFVKQISYHRLDWSMSFIRTKEDVEIDLVIERPGKRVLLVEIKSTTKVTAADAKSLETLGVDIESNSERYLLSCDKLPQSFGGTQALHWQEGLERIFSSPS